MRKIIKNIILIAIFLFAVSGCKDFPEFEGTYYGTATVLQQTYDYPEVSNITVTITRDFKRIEVLYESNVFNNFTLRGEIDEEGNFYLSGSGTSGGIRYNTVDEGKIYYASGDYISQMTVTENDEISLIMKLELQKF